MYGVFTLDLAGQAIPSDGGAGQIANPEGQDLIIRHAALLIQTASAGAATLAVGIGDEDAANNNIVADATINGAVLKPYNLLAPAAKAAMVEWGANQVLNATASAASAAFRGRLYIEYYRTADEE